MPPPDKLGAIGIFDWADQPPSRWRLKPANDFREDEIGISRPEQIVNIRKFRSGRVIQQTLPFDGRAAGVQRHSIFFAILPDRGASSAISRLQRDLRDSFGLTSPAIPSERLHVSVFGLGAFLARPDVLIERVARAAESVRLAPFDIVFDQACSFGRASNAPLVLTGKGVAGVVALAQEIAARVTRARRAPPAGCVPHLTLLYDARRVPKTPISPIRWTVSGFVLIDSLRGKGRHDVLSRWRLHGDQCKGRLSPTESVPCAATRIINEVRGANRVVCDVTSKPPGTIEWE